MQRFNIAGVIRLIRWHRLGLGLMALAIALLAGISTIATALRGPTAFVVVAVGDIAPGTQVSGTDVALARWPAELIPPDAITSLDAALGRTTVGRVSTGVPLTTALFTTAAIRGDTGVEVLVPVRIRDPAMLGLLNPGALVTLVGVAPEGYAETLAAGVRVAALPDSGSGGVMGDNSSALIIVACRRMEAIAIAAAAGMTITVIVE
ncbi:MAG: SAF domain-containing protein [Propionibacteriaceae bacterium]|nr:SAF domain-containing protein [Propionibacteriaceae bacterium]